MSEHAQRLTALKNRRPKWLTDYGRYDAVGNVEEILCFSCGTPIVSLIEMSETRGKIRVKLAPNASFTKTDLALDNGTVMSPMSCKACAMQIKLQLHDATFREDLMTAMTEAHVATTKRFRRATPAGPIIAAMKNLKIKGLA